MTKGIFVGVRDDAAEEIAAHWAELADKTGESHPEYGLQQSELELTKAGLPATTASGVQKCAMQSL
jgi:hypothetical protein